MKQLWDPIAIVGTNIHESADACISKMRPPLPQKGWPRMIQVLMALSILTPLPSLSILNICSTEYKLFSRERFFQIGIWNTGPCNHFTQEEVD